MAHQILQTSEQPQANHTPTLDKALHKYHLNPSKETYESVLRLADEEARSAVKAFERIAPPSEDNVVVRLFNRFINRR